jgi:DNA (cytosine-5)-methyltransferase 1
MKHGSLFSGIGGFDLAAEWMGWENVFHCEWNDFGKKVLKHYWPNSISYNDITKTDFSIHRRTIDILTGGFPCQPYSAAGKRLGKEDERHLWPEMLRAIREIQPRWIVGENVFGLVNWNGGMVFEEVQADLEVEGYEVQPYVLPAAAVNAPHRRDRVWFIAYTDSNGLNECNNKYEINASERRFNALSNADKGNEYWDATNSSEQRLEREGRKRIGFTFNNTFKRIWNWNSFPTVSPICTRDDGISNRLDGITFPKWRNESIKAGGNAIVPQVVFQIFKAIHIFETQNLKP